MMTQLLSKIYFLVDRHIKKCEVVLMSKDTLKGLIDLIDENDVNTIYNVLIRFIPESNPLPDEIEAIEKANQSIETNGTISHDDIQWD